MTWKNSSHHANFMLLLFFGKKKKVRDFILAQRTEGEGSIFFNNVGSARELFI